MIGLIFYKWSINYQARDHFELINNKEVFIPGTSTAPGIINTMINLPLKLGSTVIVYFYLNQLGRSTFMVGYPSPRILLVLLLRFKKTFFI